MIHQKLRLSCGQWPGIKIGLTVFTASSPVSKKGVSLPDFHLLENENTIACDAVSRVPLIIFIIIKLMIGFSKAK